MTNMTCSEMRVLSDTELDAVAGGIGPVGAFALGVAAGAAVAGGAFLAGVAVGAAVLYATSDDSDEKSGAVAPAT